MVTTPTEITSTVSMTATITAVTVATINSTSFQNHSLNTQFDSTSVILISVMTSVIGDIAVILTISILIVCVVIRFKKGHSNILSTTTASELRSHTVERSQTINPLPGIYTMSFACYISIHVILKLFSITK